MASFSWLRAGAAELPPDPLRGDSQILESDPRLMDFFPSELTSPQASVAIPKASVSAPRAPVTPRNANAPASLGKRDDSKAGDVSRLNLNVTRVTQEVQGLGVTLGQLRTMAGELDERYRTLLQSCSAADERIQRMESTFARIDSLAQMRLNQLNDAGDLATRTEKMLARVEGLSADTDRQLAAIADVRSILSRELAQARAEAKSRANVTGAPPVFASSWNSRLVRFSAAMTGIQKRIPRPSRVALVYAALAVFSVAAIGATWPDGSGSRVGVPVVQSRVLSGSGLQLPQLPQGLVSEVPLRLVSEVPPRLVSKVRSSAPRVASPVRAAGYVGELAIQSSPPGATVFIDGKPAGETPMSSLHVRAGSHAIWIELPRHHRWTTAVRVRAGGLTTINATLQAAPDGRQAR